MENLLTYLTQNINKTTSIEKIMETFQKMCQKPCESMKDGDPMVIFKATTDNFSGKGPEFTISLARQLHLPTEDGENYFSEEFAQIRVEMYYKSSEESKNIKDFKSNDNLEDKLKNSIFDYIKKSQAYDFAKTHIPERIEIFIDET